MKNYFSLASPHTFYFIGGKGNAFWEDKKTNCNKKHSEDSHITTDDYPKMPLLRRVEQGQCDGCAWLETKLQRQRDGEQWAVDMLLMDDVDELLHDSGMLDDNTLVIFTSDNGPHEEGGADPTFFNRDGKLRGLKRQCYEGGIRIPFIARWKGHIAAGQVSALPFAFYDLMPTFSKLAGVKNCAQRYRNRRLKTDYFDGLSIVPTLLCKNIILSIF